MSQAAPPQPASSPGSTDREAADSVVPGAGDAPALDALPQIRTPLEPALIVKRLDVLARRGKLAGFAPGRGDVLFEVACFGEPFDRVLEARAAREGTHTLVRFSTRVLARVPAIFAAVTAITVWPGVWLTDSMLTTYFSWYRIPTWWWYIPLTVVPLFWMVPRMVRKSERACRESAAHQISAISAALDVP